MLKLMHDLNYDPTLHRYYLLGIKQNIGYTYIFNQIKCGLRLNKLI